MMMSTRPPPTSLSSLRMVPIGGMESPDSAMVADEALAEAVIDQPGIADGAGEAMAAGTAQGQRRIAAAVEEQQRLLALLDRAVDLACEPRRDEAAAGRHLAAEINRLDMRH